jgi:predicted  nucleic acid-binding Zn-ribbon protein
MKKIIYSLVIMIAASTLFTSCLEYVEPVGIQQLRTAKADYLDALATLRLADAELQRANAAYVLAQTAYVDAMTAHHLITNRIYEYDVQIKAAETELEVDRLKKEKELLQITHAADMAWAKEQLAWAEEQLRVALRAIAAVQHLLTDEERIVLAEVTANYLDALEEYNLWLYDLEEAKEVLWNLEYAFNDATDWGADYQGHIDFFTAEIARAQLALNTVPQNLDLEDWNAEVENLKDSIDAYNYGRQVISKDSVLYMTNVYCEGSEAYERALEAWLAQFKGGVQIVGTTLKVDDLFEAPEDHAGDEMVAAPTKPKAADYALNSKRAELSWNIVVTPKEKADIAAKLVYDKFVDLITDYATQIAPFGDSTNIANGAYYGKVVHTAGDDTLKIQARADMKDFILNDDTDVKQTYKWKKGNVQHVSEGLYGLKGAYSILERHLVLIEAGSNVAALQTAYNKAKKAWKDDRDYLINKTHLAEQAAALANMKTCELKPAVHRLPKDGRAEDLMFAITQYRISRTQDGKQNSTTDTTTLVAAIRNFYQAKAAYIGDAHKDHDRIEYVDFAGNKVKLWLGDLTYEGLIQKRIVEDMVSPHDDRRYQSLYGGKVTDAEAREYKTVDNELNKAVDPGWIPAGKTERDYDAILKIFHVIFPNAPDGTFDSWGDAMPWLVDATNNVHTENLTWMIVNPANPGGPAITAAKAPTLIYDNTKADLNLEGAGSKKFVQVYNRFWNPAVPLTVATIDQAWDAGCYSDTTFNVPYRLVRFTGGTINDHLDLRVVLSLIDPLRGVVGTNTHDWVGKVDDQSAIFGEPGRRTEFYEMLKAEEDLILEKAKTTYRATMDRIKAEIDKIEADFDARIAKLAADYAAAQANYNADKAAWDAYTAAIDAKKKELLKELTGSEKGKVVKEIAKPDANTHNVPTSMKKYFDHEGLPVWNGEYALGGKQLEWANEFLKDYPAKLKEWMIATRTANHVIMHLNAIMDILDPAYRAATKIYTYDWQKYVLNVDPITHAYNVDVAAIKRDYDAGAAATLLDYFANYNEHQKEYREAWTKYLNDCTVQLGYWKQVLAAYEAGYDPLEMAIKEQRGIVEVIEGWVAVYKKYLEEAEAEYKATIAKLLK